MARKATTTTKRTTKAKTTRTKTAKPKTAAAADPSVKVTKPAAKTSAAKAKAPVKAAPVVQPVEAEVVDAPILRKPDLIERIAARTEIKRRDIKAVMELVLDELGQALERGDDVIAQPMGRLRVARKNEQDNATVYVAKIRRPKSTGDATSQGDGETGVEPAAKDA